MTPEQYKEAERIQKLINSHKGIFNLLYDASNSNKPQVEIKFAGRTYTLPEVLIVAFKTCAVLSISDLEKEFSQL